MPRHPDFEKIYKRFIAQYGKTRGKDLYHAWLNKKGYAEEKPLPGKKQEKKEIICSVRGFEIKETPTEYHIEGLIATSHIDELTRQEGIEIPDKIPKETLESFANQINTNERARVMGVHHSEGNPIQPEYFGKADVEKTPAEVIQLSDGEWGLYVDTVLLKDDPKTPEIIEKFESGELHSFSITYDTDRFLTTDFDWVGDDLVRILNPETQLYGYTAASEPVNPSAVATGFGFKEFKELVQKNTIEKKEEVAMMQEETKEVESKEVLVDAPSDMKADKTLEEKATPSGDKVIEPESKEVDAEKIAFDNFKAEKKEREQKELLEKQTKEIIDGVVKHMEVKEKVLKETDTPMDTKELSLEVKEFRDVINNKVLDLKEQARRVGALCDSSKNPKLDWQTATTKPIAQREFKTFGVKGRELEYKGLGITTNQNTDTDYLQSSAELQDVYDPVMYNGLNQATVTWTVLAKDDFSKKGNNQVQFTLKTAANTSAAFYTGNAVTTGNVGKLKFQTKFKKLQVGVSVDGDMIAAARGGPVGDVFAQEVMESTMDMLAVLNAALYAEVGLETAAGPIGFEYITDSAGNTSLYNLTRSTANLLAPASAGNTYINQSSTVISMANLRAAKRQAVNEGANKRNLVFFTSPTQADMFRGKFDDSRRFLSDKDTAFGFKTDIFIDGIPVFEDKDCNTDDWFLVDLETHRVGIWVPPTIEKLGKTADSDDAYIKMYFATYNRAPRRMVQIYGAATS